MAVGGLLLALAITAVPMSRLAHQSLNSSGGSLPVWFSAADGAVGLVVAWRKPGNPLGWIFLLVGLFSALAEDASFYMVADYRVRHGSLPLGWAAVLTQPGWAPTIAPRGGRPALPGRQAPVAALALGAVGLPRRGAVGRRRG